MSVFPRRPLRARSTCRRRASYDAGPPRSAKFNTGRARRPRHWRRGMIRSQHQCEACGTVFWFVRKRVPGCRHPLG